ncbi:EAL domain-containing protein [Thalassoporum mexicanum]|uniref:EAL domain-containing protein n=1 Tax=Thalassoporum mexicanum TaxID=3457544 RepID=UPI0002EAE523|nr:EAL domain-containing protein [Pseudanabaena sp. PCC 7367]
MIVTTYASTNSGATIAEVIQKIAMTNLACETPATPSTLLELESRGSQQVPTQHFDYIVVNDDQQFKGILTATELLPAIASQLDLSTVTVSSLLPQQSIVLTEEYDRDVFAILALRRQHRVNFVPVVDQAHKLLGIVSVDSICQSMQPGYLLKHSQVSAYLNPNVVLADQDTSVLAIAQQMCEQKYDIAVVVQRSYTGLLLPAGIITSADIVQLKALGLELAQLPVGKLVIHPLPQVKPHDSLYVAYQIMQRSQTNLLIVCGSKGELVGTIELSDLFKVLDPMEMYGQVEVLQQQVSLLQAEKLQLLEQLEQKLDQNQNNDRNQAAAGGSQNVPIANVVASPSRYQNGSDRPAGSTLFNYDPEYLLAKASLHLRQSLDLAQILETAVEEIQQYLAADRVIISHLQPDGNGNANVEALAPMLARQNGSILGRSIRLPELESAWMPSYVKGNAQVVCDIYNAGLEPRYIEFFENLGVGAFISVPVLQGVKLWGLIIVHHCSGARPWQQWQIEFLERLAVQLVIVVHQSLLLEQSQIELAERKRAEAQLLHNAFHDALTGLPNRSLFNDRLNHAIERAKRRSQSAFAVLFLDLDRFKVVNDSLGHAIGDQLLMAIAQRLLPQLEPSDTLARLGGDEFVILLEDIDNPQNATKIAEVIKQQLSQPFHLSGHDVFVSASIGIVFSEVGYDSAADVLRDVDIAMYRAKNRGKAQHVVFDRSMHVGIVARLQAENDLRKAIEREELELHYQPILSLENNKISGLEALIRWQHPTRGLVSPGEFIPLAEETGLILAMGEWVIRNACRQLRQWQQAYAIGDRLYVSINLSGHQIAQMTLFDVISQVLTENNLNPASLKLEITETVIMENIDTARALLEKLRSLGVQVYIDDFGTGYSSFSYLQNLPVDVLKIDRSFISRISNDANSWRIVQTIMNLARSLGLRVIAEGVESTEQMACLVELGQEFAQGYLISRPLNRQLAEELIRQL